MISPQEILNANILIVDDDKANILLLAEMLRDVGYSCISATTKPFKVCYLHQKNHYDLILLDLQMPGMDGFSVMECLQKIEANGYIPVIVITSQPELKLRALSAGAKDFVSKPFDLIEVQTRIHNMLEVRLLYKQHEHNSHLMEFLALHDALTALPNRRLLMDRFSSAIAHARRNNRTIALMYLDLDGFKLVNDSLGHDTGDILLNMVAARLIDAVRQEDTVARLGGDEFMIALWNLDNDNGVSNLASKVIQAISRPYSIQGRVVKITASIGISIYPTHGEGVEMLMKNADIALYDAKHAGKNSYCIAA